ncbi:RNA-binding protein [Zafaria cholistanensis]|uniref:RNA-binding protein n=1 Tax=Zafaria cholistanensis TaxID=1682741 RepID=A0A5A7NSV8_9MICC|nr:GAF and ANTAR domain-containing protein [Zafaria cholistanensis]GER22987.1 RNA-binding protein [Zafaria cholistanensis]
MDQTFNWLLEASRIAAALQERILASEDVADFLAELARHAADTLSGAGSEVYCSVTLLRDKNRISSAGSGEQSLYMDETQYKCGGGPCLYAAQTHVLIDVPEVDKEPRWRSYLDLVRDTGVKAILGVPFNLEGNATGALNLYATRAHAFDNSAPLIALYAEQASLSLRLALRMGELAEMKEHLAAAMESRTAIDIAIGILMAENRCDQEQAFSILRRASSNRNAKIRDLAAEIAGSVAGKPVQTYFKP